MGLYLLVCLAFVFCALVEFAIALILHRRKEWSGESDVDPKSLSTERKKKSSFIPLKVNAVTSEQRPDVLTPNSAVKCQVDVRMEPQKSISIILSTNVIDFVSIWIYLVLFLMFNCIYWDVY